MIGGIKNSSSSLPPGFRFHPTDEELIIHYLRNQATSKPCPVSIIPEVDIYKFDPWQLPEKAEFGEKEWYFFTPRDRKYPNGVRPNRAAVSGYWKATGTDKAIYSGSKYIGVKKALVFYKGRPPKGVKTDWIMHEYRLSESRAQTFKQNGSMRLDDWVLCRIYKKKITMGRSSFDHEPKVEDSSLLIKEQQQQEDKFPRNYSLNHLWEFDCMASISQIMNDNSSSYNNVNNNNVASFMNNQETAASAAGVNYYNGSGSTHQSDRGTKFQVNPTVFVNPPYELQ